MAGRLAQDWDSLVEGSEDAMAVEGCEGDSGGGLHCKARQELVQFVETAEVSTAKVDLCKGIDCN